MFKIAYNYLCIAALSAISLSAVAETPDELDLLGSYGSEELVSIAAGYQQPITKAPGIASVITARDIKAMGARDLNEVLETVPGLHVTVSSTYNPIFVMRGIYSEFNPQILFLINGVPITNFLFGNRGQVWSGMLIENIARIEVMRSPGSAIYGADAVAGVVNIITKTSDDINGTTVGGQLGSFNHKQVWVQHGANYAGWKSAFSLQVQSTDGQSQIVTADAQTAFDAVGTTASLAPGPVNTNRDLIDASIDLSKGNWRGHLNYQGRDNVGIGAGLAQALDPEGNAKDDRFLADLSYRNTDFHPDWDLDATLSYFNASNKSSLVLFPAGANFTGIPPGGGGGPFPNGVRGIPAVKEQHWRFESSGLFTGFEKHAIRIGLGYHNGDMYEVTESRNYSLSPAGLPIPLTGGITDVTDTAVFVKESKRTIYFTYIQDEWKFAADWAVTAGLRYDDYSDFGTTLNPRLALVWQTTYNLTSKLLYNRAFRPPSFAEQFNINNPVALGNPNLDPETIDTIEMAFNYRATERLTTDLTLFHYTLKDIIRFVTNGATSKMAQNTAGQVGYGLEWEMKWKVSRDVDLSANYALQHSENRNTKINTGIAPEQQLYIRSDWRFIALWSMNAQLNHVHGRTRESGDSRAPVDNYTTIDLTLRRAADHNGIEYAVSVRNLLDSNAFEPSLAPGLIPNDLPLAGRSAFAEIRYSW